MPQVLRKTTDEANPKLPDAWGVQQTKGRLVYWYFDGTRTYFLIIFGRGGKYGWDGMNFFHYKGAPIPEFPEGFEGDESFRSWRFHPGTVTKQISVRDFTADDSGNIFTCNGHGYENNDPVRIRSLGGVVPSGLAANQKYYVINATTNTFQISETSAGSAIDFTSAGTGTLKVWKADAGFDDPLQGRPQFFPELNLTFSNICYMEGILPETYSADEEPVEFEYGVRCRKVADYDVNGNYLGNSFSANNARVFADILFNDLKLPSTRLNWPSWFAYKQACDVMIWDRVATDGTAAGTGIIGRYYTGINFDTLYKTKLDAQIDFTWANGDPVEGDFGDSHSIEWESRLKPEYSEIYTFKIIHNDGVRLTVNNEIIIDQWVGIGDPGGLGTHTGMISLTGGALYNIKLEFRNFLGGQCSLYWSSASRSEQIIPVTKFYPSDSQATRFEAHVVFDGATQCGAALNEVTKRSPGWHVQDVGGELTFLPPDRPVVHTFLYDPAAPNERFNIAAKTYAANPRKSSDRANYRVHYYNDVNDELLKEKWVEGNRDGLRDNQGGLPSDVAPARWGVMSHSLANRIAENEMTLFSDPDRDFTFRGQSDSYHVSKGDRVLAAHIATGETFAEPIECLVAGEQFGAGNGDEKSYSLLPVAFPLITDEQV